MTPTIVAARPATSRYRWVICALLFFATVISYVDRGVLGLLEKGLETEIGWDAVGYGYMTAGFQAAYAIGLLVAGRVTDRLGTRRAFSYAMVLWSLAAMSRGLLHSALAFGVAMFVLGIGEAANCPACIMTVAEWFPKKERAFATGIFNSGANIGNIATPALVPILTEAFTWKGTFVITGLTGFVWLVFWLWLYHKPEEAPNVSAAELQLIHSDPPEKKDAISWSHLIPCKETWAFAIGKFLTDPIWWFYLFWLPTYLRETFHLTLSQISSPIVIVYTISCAGSIGGGYISAALLKRGVSANAARKIALLVCALCVVPVIYAPFATNLWVVVGLVGLAAAAHQGWSANLFTLTSDLFPKAAVASVVGIGGMLGSLGGVLFQPATGYVRQTTGSYVPMFVIAGLAYVTALIIIHALSPKLEPAKVD
jgi:ACS family hexuronate transporter-like MFS transporter